MSGKNIIIEKDSFASLHFAQNDKKLGWQGLLGGLVWRHRRQTNPPNSKKSPKVCHSEQSEESVKFLSVSIKNKT